MLLVREIIIDLRLDLKCSKHVISGGDGPHEGCVDTMVDMITYDYEELNLKDHTKR